MGKLTGTVSSGPYAGMTLEEVQAKLTAEAEQKSAYEQGRKDWEPYREFGENALKDVNALSADPSLVTKLPGYQFRLGQGRELRENNAAAKGGLLSGNALRGMEEYGQNFATDEYDKEYTRRMGKVGAGLTAAGGSAGLTSEYMKMLVSMYANRPKPREEDDGGLGRLVGTGLGYMVGGPAGAYYGNQLKM